MLLTACADAGGSNPEASVSEHTPEPVVSPTEPEQEADEGEADEEEPQRPKRFSRQRTMQHVRRLASDIGVRVRGTRGERRAARYIRKRFRALGYETNVQTFSVDGRTSRNVVAWWPGAQRYPVVIGGHMDTVPRSPGANDNASGVAVVLEAARMFAGTRQARFVRFVAFGSEEYGRDGRHHVGSQTFVNRLGARGRRRLAGMVSVDMIGKVQGGPHLIGTSGIGPEIVARTLYRKARRAGLSVRYRTLCPCSDNAPFERAGIPGAFMWSGWEPNYHSPRDTVPNVEPGAVTRAGRIVRAFVKDLNAATLRRFRNR
jgi:Iap family predicted aminopeptidase